MGKNLFSSTSTWLLARFSSFEAFGQRFLFLATYIFAFFFKACWLRRQECLLCVLSHFSHVWLFVTPMGNSLPGSSVHEIFPARILEWVPMLSSRRFSRCRDWTQVSCIADSLQAEPEGDTRESVRKVKNRIFCNLIIEVISHQFCYILLVTKFSLYLRRRDYRWVWVTGGSGGLVARLCPILCDPMDCRPPGYSVYEISQARILEWVDISFSSEVKVIRHLLQILTFLRKK